MKAKITVRSVESIQPGPKDIVLWDSELAGFCCKVTPTGRRTYFLYYRTKDGTQRRPAIGQHSVIKPEAARAIAKAWLGDVALGLDPSLTRAQDKTAPTFDTLCNRYSTEHANVRKKASSAAEDGYVTAHAGTFAGTHTGRNYKSVCTLGTVARSGGC